MEMSAKKIFSKIRKEKRKLLAIDESFDVLKKYKIDIADYAVVKDVKEAVTAADKLNYPVVVKIISKKVTHKTDIGGIQVDLNSSEEVKKAFDKISKNVKKAKVSIDGFMVQKMINNGQLVIIGGKKDPQFGQTVVFGAGGIYVEAFDDIAVRVTPITEKDAKEMMEETDIYSTLKNFRGKTYDIDALQDILMKVSKMLEENQEIAELDINPILALQKGAVAVDARILLE